jgi:hypothetical protein
MTIKIEIASQAVQNRSGVSGRTGKKYSINEQIAYLHKPGQHYPDKIKLSLSDNQSAYPVGNYDLCPSSFFVDKFGALAVRPVLLPLAQEQSRSGSK